jgi:hypothetical protein
MAGITRDNGAAVGYETKYGTKTIIFQAHVLERIGHSPPIDLFKQLGASRCAPGFHSYCGIVPRMSWPREHGPNEGV